MRKIAMGPKNFKITAEAEKKAFSFSQSTCVKISFDGGGSAATGELNWREAAAIGSWFQDLSNSLRKKQK